MACLADAVFCSPVDRLDVDHGLDMVTGGLDHFVYWDSQYLSFQDIFRSQTTTLYGRAECLYEISESVGFVIVMNNYLLILPIALLVSYSQIIIKWRTARIESPINAGFISKIINILLDPVILSAYVAALFASFAWLYVVTKLPLTIAFPLYIGVIIIFVMLGGWIFLSESITYTKILAIVLIFSGIVIGINSK